MKARRAALAELHELFELEASVRQELASIMEDRAEAMRKLCDDHGMTTYELARAVHMSQSRVTTLVKGARDARYG